VISGDALVIRLKRKSPHAPFVHEIRKSDNFRRLRVFVLRNRLNYDGSPRLFSSRGDYVNQATATA